MRTSGGRHLINQFLSEMDGVAANNDGVLILAATNAPWHVDPASAGPAGSIASSSSRRRMLPHGPASCAFFPRQTGAGSRLRSHRQEDRSLQRRGF